MKQQKFGGRTKGTPNRDTKELRERISALIDNNFESIQADLDTLPPKEKLDFLVKLFEYALPKLNRTEIETTNGESLNKDLSQYTTEELLKRANAAKAINEQ